MPGIVGCVSCGFHFLDELSAQESEFYSGGDVEGYLRLAPRRRRYFLALKKGLLSTCGCVGDYRCILDVGCASAD